MSFLLESVRVALDMLRMYKLRAFLTMLGVIIGVMSVTMIVMVKNGFHHYMTNQIEELGARTLMIMYDGGRMRRGESHGRDANLTSDDVQYLRDRASTLRIVSPLLQIPQQEIVFGDNSIRNPRIIAVDNLQAELSAVTLLAGRFMTKSDLDSRANVCLIGEDIETRLFQGQSAIGKLVTFPGITLEVIGVMEAIELLGQSSGLDVWVPITTAQAKWVGGDSVSFITALPYDDIEVEDAMDDVWQVLMIKSGNRPVYRVDSRESIIKIFGGIVNGAGVILAGIAALSLLVGGIGIMNIMLVSVTERTKEIGLRKAVGARKIAIMTQFLVESAMLSLVGGMIGMGIAFSFGKLISIVTSSMDWPSKGGLLTPFPIQAAIMACVFSALIGVVFGLYPAGRAAQLSPIEALRSE
ncbi:MAG: ABC transporter permease [Armatimonadetes bacterium]|nr:ABC transporter permease [Armatimonadota bacterium]